MPRGKKKIVEEKDFEKLINDAQKKIDNAKHKIETEKAFISEQKKMIKQLQKEKAAYEEYKAKIDEKSTDLANDPKNNPEFSKRIEQRFADIFSKGKKCPGIGASNSPLIVPSWYDKAAFKHAQELFHTYALM